MPKIIEVQTADLRFPTSDSLDGSDAMHSAPDYSAAYCVLKTDGDESGCGFAFTCGRGNEICVAAIQSLAPMVAGADVDSLTADMRALQSKLVDDEQLRWLGPHKGVSHMAAAAVMNAAWDLRAKRAGRPLWRHLAEMTSEEIVNLVDWRHLRDALDEEGALAILRKREGSRAARVAEMERDGYPAYVTSAGWLGYPDEKIRRLAGEAMESGWNHFKMKVGRDLGDDRRRAGLLRGIIGDGRKLMMDANQVWGVREAIENTNQLAEFGPWWMEEPTHPDDILGHREIAAAVAPVRVATGEHCANAVMFKQFLQSGAMAVAQIDACRLAGVNENIAVMLLAEKFGVPVCPHAGGVGLCEHVQHLAMFYYAAVSASLEDRVLEFADHLHEHFVHPVRVSGGRYRAPQEPGYGAEIKPESVKRFRFAG